MKWTRSEATESRISSYGVKWCCREIKVDEISVTKSLANQARCVDGSINEDLVLEYAIAMNSADAAFEQIIVVEIPNSRYMVVDGNHRSRAATLCDKPLTSLAVYVVVTDDQVLLDLIIRTWNYGNGLRPSAHERKHQVLQFRMEHPGVTDETLAKHFHVKRKTVSTWLRERQVHQVLEKRGVILGPAVTARLTALIGDEDVLCKAGMLARDYQMTGAQTQELVGAIRQRRSLSSKIEAAEEYAKSLGSRPLEARVDPLRVSREFRNRVAMLTRFLNKYPTYEHLQLTADTDYNEAEYYVGILVQKLMEAMNRTRSNKAMSNGSISRPKPKRVAKKAKSGRSRARTAK